MSWTPDDRHMKTFGPFTLTPERQGGETAHRVDLPGGLSVRALPDGQTSGQKRSHVVSKALAALGLMDPTPGYDLAANYLVGQLALSDIHWEWCDLAEEARAAVAIEEWLDAWFDETVGDVLPEAATQLLRALHDDGWKVTR